MGGMSVFIIVHAGNLQHCSARLLFLSSPCRIKAARWVSCKTQAAKYAYQYELLSVAQINNEQYTDSTMNGDAGTMSVCPFTRVC